MYEAEFVASDVSRPGLSFQLTFRCHDSDLGIDYASTNELIVAVSGCRMNGRFRNSNDRLGTVTYYCCGGIADCGAPLQLINALNETM